MTCESTPFRRVRPSIQCSSIEHRLVHPWGARPRGNGRQPEATGRRFPAQNRDPTVIQRGVPTVQLPLAHVWLRHDVLRRLPRRTRLSPLPRRDFSSCGRGCSSQSPKSRRCTQAINLRQIFGQSAGAVHPRGCTPSQTRASSKTCFAGGALAKAWRTHHWAVEVLLADAIGVWIPEMPIRMVGAHPECSRKEH